MSAILVLVSPISQQSFISPANWVVVPEFTVSQSHATVGKETPKLNGKDIPAVLNVTLHALARLP